METLRHCTCKFRMNHVYIQSIPSRSNSIILPAPLHIETYYSEILKSQQYQLISRSIGTKSRHFPIAFGHRARPASRQDQPVGAALARPGAGIIVSPGPPLPLLATCRVLDAVLAAGYLLFRKKPRRPRALLFEPVFYLFP